MKRQPGIDLVRCVGLLFVISVHQFLYNGFYYQPQTGALMWASNSCLWLFFCCNGIFMMLTGYLKCEKKFTKEYYKSLIPILIGYLFCCVVIFPLQYLLLAEKPSLSEWIDKLVGFGNYAWYVEMYIGLLLISPGINLMLENIKSKKGLYLAAGVLFSLTALNSITAWNVIPDYWKSLYPVTYYVLGAVIRKLQLRLKPWQGLGLAAIVSMWVGLMTLLTTDKGFSDGYTQGYGGFWTTIITVLVFLSLHWLPIGEKTGKVLAWLSGGCFEGYMLSLIPDLWAYNLVKQWHSPDKYLLVYLCVTIPIFIVSLLAGKLVHTLAEKTYKLLFLRKKRERLPAFPVS